MRCLLRHLWPPSISWDSGGFSRYYLVYQTSPCHNRLFSSSRLLITNPALTRSFHILPLREVLSYSTALKTRARLYVFLLLSTTGTPPSFRQIPGLLHEIAVPAFSPRPLGRTNTFSFLRYLFLDPPCISQVFPLFHLGS